MRQPSSLSAFPYERAKVAFGASQGLAKPTFNKENRAFLPDQAQSAHHPAAA